MNQNPRELKNVELFFDGYSSDFDNIYDDTFNHLSLNLIDNEEQNIIHYFEICIIFFFRLIQLKRLFSMKK